LNEKWKIGTNETVFMKIRITSWVVLHNKTKREAIKGQYKERNIKGNEGRRNSEVVNQKANLLYLSGKFPL